VGDETYTSAVRTVRAVLGMFAGPDAVLAATVVFVRCTLLFPPSAQARSRVQEEMYRNVVATAMLDAFAGRRLVSAEDRRK